MKQTWLGLVLLVSSSAPSFAQAPRGATLFPPGGRAGSQVAATLSGSGLNDVKSFLVSGKGVSVQKASGGDSTTLPLQVGISAEADPGLYEIRLLSPHGASNPIRFWVDSPGYPEVQEKEPNDSLAQAQMLTTTPVTVNGRIDRAEDLDCYTFNANAGETWIFALNAARHLSQMDGFLSLRDARGRDLRTVMDNFGRDPELTYTFPAAGKYELRVRDSLYRGGPGYTYRLTLGKIPYVTGWSPRGVVPGKPAVIRLHGVNLGSTTSATVTVPMSAALDQFTFVPRVGSGFTNPVTLRVSDLPESEEHEPNDTPQSATRVDVPTIVTGQIDHADDRDVYAFAGKKGSSVFLDVLARREGSRLDSVLRVLDSSGKELATNDDAVGKDSRLLFAPPADGTYYAEVRGLTTRSGDDFFYRLRISSPPPDDFSLTLEPETITVPAGASIPVTVTAARQGYTGEIAIAARNLPAGVSASPATLRAGQNTAVVTLTAAPGTEVRGGALQLIGTAKIGSATVEHPAQGIERYQPPLATAQQMQTRGVLLPAVGVGPEAPFSLAATLAAPMLKAGQKVDLTVHVTRKGAFKEDVVVTLLGLPANLTASALTIKGNQAEGKLTLTAGGATAVGPHGLVVLGAAKAATLAIALSDLTITPAK